MPDASAPRTKYFIAASVAAFDVRCIATIAYSDSACSSRPMYSVMKWFADTITMMPSSAVSVRTKVSPLNSPRASR